MQIHPLAIPDVLLITPKVFEDERGFFMEAFNQRDFQAETGLDVSFVQDNHSLSGRNVLRGLHYQLHHPQGKLVRVTRGEVFDVAVDMREGSVTLGWWVSTILNESNKKQLWIPPGFAHGFFVMSEFAELEYKCTDYYHPEDEVSVSWCDTSINIAWPEKEKNSIVMSKKDTEALPFVQAPRVIVGNPNRTP